MAINEQTKCFCLTHTSFHLILFSLFIFLPGTFPGASASHCPSFTKGPSLGGVVALQHFGPHPPEALQRTAALLERHRHTAALRKVDGVQQMDRPPATTASLKGLQFPRIRRNCGESLSLSLSRGRSIGRRHRSGAKSRSSRGPMGKFSSDFRGCNHSDGPVRPEAIHWPGHPHPKASEKVAKRLPGE